MDEILETVAEEMAEAATSSADELGIDGLERGPPVLGDTAELIGDTVDAVADASPNSVGTVVGETAEAGAMSTGAIIGEAVSVADKVFNAADEINNAAEQIEGFQDTLQTNLDATVNATDAVHHSIRDGAAASRQAYQRCYITWDEHQANIDQFAQQYLDVSAAIDQQIEGQVQAAQSGMGAAALSGAARALAKTTDGIEQAANLPIVGEAGLEGIGLPDKIE